jgi:hypothetical protein
MSSGSSHERARVRNQPETADRPETMTVHVDEIEGRGGTGGKPPGRRQRVRRQPDGSRKVIAAPDRQHTEADPKAVHRIQHAVDRAVPARNDDRPTLAGCLPCVLRENGGRGTCPHLEFAAPREDSRQLGPAVEHTPAACGRVHQQRQALRDVGSRVFGCQWTTFGGLF